METIELCDLPSRVLEYLAGQAEASGLSLSELTSLYVVQAVESEQSMRHERRRRVLAALAEGSWTPPAGAPDVLTLLRTDRDR